MTTQELKAQLAALQAENEALKAKAKVAAGGFTPWAGKSTVGGKITRMVKLSFWTRIGVDACDTILADLDGFREAVEQAKTMAPVVYTPKAKAS
jgi:hypothetical protein